MSIASAITAAQARVANAYTSVSAKGGAMPVTANLDNLPTAIESIPTGGGESAKYGISIDSVIGDVTSAGVLQPPTSGPTDVVLSGVTKISEGALPYKFKNNLRITSFSAPDVIEIYGDLACVYMLGGCGAMTTLNLHTLASIGMGLTGSQAPCAYMCSACDKLSSVDVSSLSDIQAYGLYGCFSWCVALKVLAMPALKNIGDRALGATFQNSGITELTLGGTNAITLDAGAFGTNATSYMFRGCSQDITVTAPAANQTEIEAMTGYPNFGCSGTVTWNWAA